jgi:methyl-accepting chemotaxis protein
MRENMQFLKNLRISVKIWGGFSLILLAIALLSMQAIGNVEENKTGFISYRELARDTNLVGRLQANILLMNIAANEYINKKTQTSLSEYESRENNFLRFLAIAQKEIQNPKRAALVDAVENNAKKIIADFSMYRQLSQQRADTLKVVKEVTGKLDATLTTAVATPNPSNPHFVHSLSKCYITFTQARMNIVKALYAPSTILDQEHLNEIMDNTKKYLRVANNNIITNAERAAYSETRLLFEQYMGLAEKLYSNMASLRELSSSISKYGELAASDAEKVKLSVMADQDILGPKMQASNESSYTNLLTISVGTLLIALILSFFTSRSITIPLHKIHTFATSLRDGDLSAQIVINEKNELGAIATALTQMGTAISNMEKELDNLVSSIAVGEFLDRSNASDFSGGYRKVLDNANRMTDMFVHFINSLPIPVLTMNKSLDVLFANRLALSLSNASLSDFVGKSSNALVPRDDFQTDTCAVTKAITSGSEKRSFTKIRTDGVVRDVDCIGVPIMQDNKAVGALQVMINHTEIIEAQEKLKAVAHDIEIISERLKANSSNLADNFNEVRSGAELQSQRTAETSTAIEQMNTSVSEVAMNASKAHTNALKAKEESEDCSNTVFKAVQSISEVSTTTQELQQNTVKLSEQVDAIGSIMNVISDIADQTNLLALNAAIEAARAGDAGKGFAVVADEVRNLAEKTMQATEQVSQSVSTIQSAAQRNFDTVSHSVQTVEQANSLATESENSLRTIMELIDQNTSQVGEIATASEEQSAVAEQISRSAEEVASTIEKSSSEINESANSIQDIATMTNELHALVARLSA